MANKRDPVVERTLAAFRETLVDPEELLRHMIESLPKLRRVVDARRALDCGCDAAKAEHCTHEECACPCHGAINPQ